MSDVKRLKIGDVINFGPEAFKLLQRHETWSFWEVKKRIGNDQPGIPRRWAVTSIKIEDGREVITHVPETTEENRNYEFMLDAYEKGVIKYDAWILREKRKEEKESEDRKNSNLRAERLKVAEDHKNSLLLELAEVTKGAEDMRLFEDKKVITILNKLMLVKTFIKDAK